MVMELGKILRLTIFVALRNAQDTLEGIAEILEKIQNTWNWEIGFSSATLSIAVFIITIVLYFLPIRILLSLWGVNKVCS